MCVSFLLRKGGRKPVGSKMITYRIIFKERFDLTREARVVAYECRHKDIPPHLAESSMTFRKSVMIGILVAAVYYLDIMA